LVFSSEKVQYPAPHNLHPPPPQSYYADLQSFKWGLPHPEWLNPRLHNQKGFFLKEILIKGGLFHYLKDLSICISEDHRRG
jgi:hypothetical protein